MSLRPTIAVLLVTLLLPGTAGAATLLVSDDFEDGTLNKWSDPINIVNFNAGTGIAFSGSRVARGCWGTYFNINLRSFNVAFPELYLRYRIKYEIGFDWSSVNNSNNKHVRIRTAATPNGFFYSLFKPVNTRAWIGDGSTINSGEDIPDQGGSVFTPETNRWYLYEFYFKLNTGGAANGAGWVKVDGATLLSFSGIKYRTADNVFFEEVVFLGNAQGFSGLGGDCVQIDDVEIWDGLPPATARPKAPTNLTVN